MEVGTFAKAEIHCSRLSTFTCFFLMPCAHQGYPMHMYCPEVGGRAQGASEARLERCFGGACTDTTHCRQWGLWCLFKNPGDFKVSTQLCVSHMSHMYLQVLLHRLQPLQKREKLSKEAKLAKRSSLSLERGRRLCASLPQRNDFHMPFPIFSSSIWSCFHPLLLFRKILCLHSCENPELTLWWFGFTESLCCLIPGGNHRSCPLSYFSFTHIHPRTGEAFQANTTVPFTNFWTTVQF